MEVARDLLDFLRKELAVRVDYLDPLKQESIRQLSSQRLKEPWTIDENETMTPFRCHPCRKRENEKRRVRLYFRGWRIGLHLHPLRPFPTMGRNSAWTSQIPLSSNCFKRCRRRVWLNRLTNPKTREICRAIECPQRAWSGRQGMAKSPCVMSRGCRRAPHSGSQVNRYFVNFYRQSTKRLRGYG